jgi:hypothetical protein
LQCIKKIIGNSINIKFIGFLTKVFSVFIGLEYNYKMLDFIGFSLKSPIIFEKLMFSGSKQSDFL